MKVTCTVVIAVALCLTTFAKESSPPATTKHAATTQSAPPHVKSLADARSRYETALRDARLEYLNNLKDLKSRAMKSDKLDDAIAATEAIAAAEREDKIANAEALGTSSTFTIRAGEDWQRTDVPAKKGDILILTATGTWCVNNSEEALTTYGPDGIRPDGSADWHGQFALLMARIGFKVQSVGNQTQITADRDGILEFRVNDMNLGDNTGELTVTVVKVDL